MKNRGELTLNVIVKAILALIVLAVLAYFFRSQIARLFDTFSNLITGVNESV